MKDFIEVLAGLCGAIAGVSIIFIVAVLVGWMDDFLPRDNGWDWKGALQAILFFSAQSLIAYLLAIGIIWFLRTQGQTQLNTQNVHLIYSWGFRLVALLCIWRSIQPRKQWTQSAPAPPYARLKLLGLALIAGVLSFLPSVLPL